MAWMDNETEDFLVNHLGQCKRCIEDQYRTIEDLNRQIQQAKDHIRSIQFDIEDCNKALEQFHQEN